MLLFLMVAIGFLRHRLSERTIAQAAVEEYSVPSENRVTYSTDRPDFFVDLQEWRVPKWGNAGYYEVLRKDASNDNTIGIEMCVKCDGDPNDEYDPS